MNESFAFKRPKAGKIALTSLMDVLTILLVFLLANFTSQPQELSSNGIRLPEVGTLSAGALEDELANRISVEIRTGSIALGSTRIPIGSPSKTRQQLSRSLEAASNEARQKGKPARLLIRGEATVPYQLVDWVVTAASRQGITDVKFVGQFRGEQ